MAFAHSKNALGERHDLYAHLQAVSEIAAEFARPLHAQRIARFLALWHDLGKLHPDFQRYLLESEQRERRRGYGPDHKLAGCLLADEHLAPLTFVLHGHHGGLASMEALRAFLSDPQRLTPAREALESATEAWPRIVPPAAIPLPPHVVEALDGEIFVRLLYSALVDADYLDTEAHFQGAVQRGEYPDLAQLWDRFEQDQAALTGQDADPVAQARDGIYQACLQAAPEPPGLYRLTVPTGGGKTRSAMGFALQHALAHGMERVIVAIPFISITEQTAETYRDIFEQAGGEPAVLEHHSAVAFSEDGNNAPKGAWTRLAAENWDAPIIVTTTVQLFESLFAHTPRRMRKLHRLANAVIILDEAQSLPTQLLTPILDALSRLVRQYNSTVVFSTATQPAFDAIPGFQQLEAREIIPDPARYYRTLERVTYDWRLDDPLSWAQIANLMRDAKQALAVVNTKGDALALFDQLLTLDPSALHLSAGMCGLHRHQVLKEVKRRLAAGEPCRLVSTQVVEAGVDLDFPLVLRAIGPLDSIIQAAGRCNREGRHHRGQVIVFEPEEGHTPGGGYKTATNLARAVLAAGDLDPNSPQAADRYFAQLFDTDDPDPLHIQRCRKRLDYPETASRFQMIDDDAMPVVVRYQPPGEPPKLDRLLNQLEAQDANPRALLRKLQPYMVNVYGRRLVQAKAQGLVTEILPDLCLWGGCYDDLRGLLFQDIPPKELIL